MQNLRVVFLTMCIFPLFVLSVHAAQPSNLEPLEEVPPPPKVIEGQPLDEPEVTIRKKGEDTIEEYRINGNLYMMKVTPKSGVPYYLHKDESDGGWVNDGPSKPISVPHWILFRF